MAALLLSVLSALVLLAMGDARSSLSGVLAVLVVWGLGVSLLPRPRGGPWAVLGAALLVRALVVLTPPGLSDDLYRYLWEGHAVILGGNPYLHAPGWTGWPADAIRARVNHPEVSTIYPPLALWSFALISKLHYGVLGPKVAFGLCDAALAGAMARVLAGRSQRLDGAWIYALHPLGAVESAGSGHLDSLALLAMVLAIGAWDQSLRTGRGDGGVFFATLGAGVKLFPALLLPALLRGPGSRRTRMLALGGAVGLVAVAAGPFLSAGPTLIRGLQTYTDHWSFNGSLFPALQALVVGLGGDEALARHLGLALGAALVLHALWRRRDPAELALWAGGAFVLLSPTVHPWYVCWAWVPSLLCGVRAWTLLASLAPLAYAVLATLDPTTGAWQEPSWTRPVIYLPFFAAFLLECAWRATRPGPWAIHAGLSPSSSQSPTGRDLSMSLPRSTP